MTTILTIYLVAMTIILTTKNNTALDAARALHIGALSVLIYYTLFAPLIETSIVGISK